MEAPSQEYLQLMKWVPGLPFSVWVTISIVSLWVITAEGAYRAWRQRDRRSVDLVGALAEKDRQIDELVKRSTNTAILRITYSSEHRWVTAVLNNDGERHAEQPILRILKATPQVVRWKMLPFELTPVGSPQDRIPAKSQHPYHLFDARRVWLIAGFDPSRGYDHASLDLGRGDRCELVLEASAQNAQTVRSRFVVTKIPKGQHAVVLRLEFPDDDQWTDFDLSLWESLTKEQHARRRERSDERRRVLLRDGTERDVTIADLDNMDESSRSLIFQRHPEHEPWWRGD
jgi:hypothetical protein